MLQSRWFLLRPSGFGIGAAWYLAIEAHAETLRQLYNFCADHQRYDFAQTIINRKTAVTLQEVPFKSVPLAQVKYRLPCSLLILSELPGN